MGIIYLAQNKINGKCYVGQTIKTLTRRKSQHMQDSKRHDYAFSRAIKKYGIDGFEWSILYNNIPPEQLNIAEICAIYLHDSYHCCYNSTTGGESKKIISEETRKKLSLARKGKPSPNKGNKYSEERCNEMSKARKGQRLGEENHFFGKHHNEQTKLKIGKANSEKYCGSGNPNYGRKHTEQERKKISEHSKINSIGSKNGNAKLTEQQVLEIREKFSTGKYKQIELAKEYSLYPTVIHKIIHRNTWKHI